MFVNSCAAGRLPNSETIFLHLVSRVLGPVSISYETFYCKIFQGFEAARFVLRIIRSLRNLTETSAALQPMGMPKRCDNATICRFK